MCSLDQCTANWLYIRTIVGSVIFTDFGCLVSLIDSLDQFPKKGVRELSIVIC